MSRNAILCILTVYIVCAISVTLVESEDTYCAFKDGQIHDVLHPEESKKLKAQSVISGELQPDKKSIKCEEGSEEYCYTFWDVNPRNKSDPIYIKQGCWRNPSQTDCMKQDCLSSNVPSVNLNNTRFCCCSGSYCNKHVVDVYVPLPETAPATTPVPALAVDYRKRTIIIAISLVVSIAVFVLMFYLILRMYMLRKGDRQYQANQLLIDTEKASVVTQQPSIDLGPLKCLSRLHSGQYGEVWQGQLNEMEVAVKLFNPTYKQFFKNERDIYLLPHMERDNLLRYYGATERINQDGNSSYMLVLSYVNKGNLEHYLKNNTVDWATLSKMMLSVSSGLAYLHSEFTIGGKFKPAIVHRDLKSRNILVKNDLSCVICDFGFSMTVSISRTQNGQEENTDDSSLADVGTLRYMAPEVLEGAVNLRDCEASLKQIDVYALGLMLWEVASRCSDLYQGMPVPVYKLPYEDEVGLRPSFEDMQNTVSKDKIRPKFPDVWKDTNPALRSLKETLEDCWDHDAEARLTSFCVEERVADMSTLWENRQKGMTTLFNLPYGLLDGGIEGGLVRNPTQTSLTQNSPDVIALDSIDNTATDAMLSWSDGELPYDGVIMTIGDSRRSSEVSVSEATTETTLMSPTELSTESALASIVPAGKLNSNATYAATRKVLLPHQGLNPTVERNTHKVSQEELAVCGNILVDKKLVDPDQPDVIPHPRPPTTQLINELAENLQSSLVQNDLLSSCTGLPDNLSHQTLIPQPKQPNVPGNGHGNGHGHNVNININRPPVEAAALPVAAVDRANQSRPRSDSTTSKTRSDKFKKAKNFAGKLPGLFSRRTRTESASSDESYPTENLCQPPPAAAHALMKCQSGAAANRCQNGGARGSSAANVQQQPIHLPGKCNLLPRPPPAHTQPSSTSLQTEVCLVNGAAIVQPSVFTDAADVISTAYPNHNLYNAINQSSYPGSPLRTHSTVQSSSLPSYPESLTLPLYDETPNLASYSDQYNLPNLPSYTEASNFPIYTPPSYLPNYTEASNISYSDAHRPAELDNDLHHDAQYNATINLLPNIDIQTDDISQQQPNEQTRFDMSGQNC